MKISNEIKLNVFPVPYLLRIQSTNVVVVFWYRNQSCHYQKGKEYSVCDWKAWRVQESCLRHLHCVWWGQGKQARASWMLPGVGNSLEPGFPLMRKKGDGEGLEDFERVLDMPMPSACDPWRQISPPIDCWLRGSRWSAEDQVGLTTS